MAYHAISGLTIGQKLLLSGPWILWPHNCSPRSKLGISKTTLSHRALNDGNYIPRLKQGRTPSLLTIDKVRKYRGGAQQGSSKPWKTPEHPRIGQKYPLDTPGHWAYKRDIARAILPGDGEDKMTRSASCPPVRPFHSGRWQEGRALRSDRWRAPCFDNGADALQTQLALDAYLNIKLAVYPRWGNDPRRIPRTP